MTEFILPSLQNLADPLNLFLMIAGLTGGIVIGALPGLSATMGVALMVPATFAMSPTHGLVMLGAIYAGAIYGGANSAILICTPGTPSSVATTFDGWPLCQNGQADTALYTSLLSSAFGGIIGTLFSSVSGGRAGPLRPELRRTGKLLALPFRAKHHRGHDAREHGQRHCLRRHRPAGVHHRP